MNEGVQRFSRTKMVLPLRVWLEDLSAESPTYLAHTVNTSEIGCRLGGLRTELHPGQIITLQRGQHKAPFRVIWSRQLDPRENQAGLEALEPSMNIWPANPQASSGERGHNHVAARVSVTAASSTIASSIPSDSAEVPQDKPVGNQESLSTGARRRLDWCLGVGFVVLSIGMVLYLASQTLPDSAHAAIQARVPTPPTAEELARLTPRPHHMPASLTKPLDASVARVSVTEAPTGNIVYPTPDEFITGKVELQIVVAANGLVKQIHVLSGRQPLAEAAAKAVRLWHYASATGTGPLNERQTSVTVSFLGKDAVSLEFPRARFDGASTQNN